MTECSFCHFLTDYSSLWRKESLIETRRFYSDYTTSKELGSGNYAVVKQCRSKNDGETYAVKIIKKKNLSAEERNAVEVEISILHSLSHPNILKLYSRYEDHTNIYLVTELVAGGQLFERIEKKKNYTEKETAEICKVLFKAIKYCHDRNIVHRDIKPENILLTSRESNVDLKIADFGFATHVDGENRTTFCGTPCYLAVEIVRKKGYGVKVDMWSLGVITYTLLAGYLPFEDSEVLMLFRKIARGKYEFHEKFWKNVSEDAKDLVRNLLEMVPSKRYSAKEALHCKWLKEKKTILASRSLKGCQIRLKKFNAKEKFRGAVLAISLIMKLSQLSNISSVRNKQDESANKETSEDETSLSSCSSSSDSSLGSQLSGISLME